MFSNTLKLAWRNLKAGGWYSLLNIGGLAVVLAVSVLLLWWVKDELTFDQFHPDADRIYRVNLYYGKGADEVHGNQSPAPIGVAAATGRLPGVEKAVRVADLWEFGALRVGNQTFVEKGSDLGFADENFLAVLGGLQVLYGNAVKPFPTPNSVVLTETAALKYFGTPNALGKTIMSISDKRVFTVGAVLADMPDNSTYQKKLIFPMDLRKRLFGGNGPWKAMDDDWGNFSFNTYLKLAPDADPDKVAKGASFLYQQDPTIASLSVTAGFTLQPITTQHLYDADGKDTGMQQVRMMGLIALLLLSIGCINYVNLTTARATRRAREVGVRKVVGAESGHLMRQLLVESLLTLVLSLTLAVVLIQLMIPYYRDMTGKTLGFSLLDPQVWLFLVGALVVTLLLAGVYPALLIAQFDPIRSLRGRGVTGAQAGLRRVLVITQFALATGLVFGTLVIGNQLNFLQKRDLGLNKAHIFTVQTGDKTETFRKALANESSVKHTASASNELARNMNSTGDTDWDEKVPGRAFTINNLSVSHDFIPNIGMKIMAGRNFREGKADSTSYIINETMVREMGISDPVGKRFKFHQWEGQIIGVVKDFVFNSARDKVPPTLLFLRPQWNSALYVRTSGETAKQALAATERVWKQTNPQYPFEYRFLDDSYDQLYKSEQRTGQLFRFFAGIAILISCLGLFGLAAFTAEQRTKEIGVRKVLGASISSIVMLLSKDFLTLVIIAIVIASPVAWWAMNAWLQGFAYKIDIAWWVFALAGFVAVGIALFTVSFQSIRAALMNPVKSLRSE